ncbi:MAG: DUF2914 domain-containing protein [Methylotenera sp.]|nr:DUF2914 domain-containing protein [Methylotenera sp.]MSQ00109.1 DUF2914 domain-containing protein [Methylotenera sp.]
MVIAKLKQSRAYQHLLKLPDFLPAIFFFCGFAWDAVTIGRNVAASDLIILAAYLLAAAGILFFIGRPSYILHDATKTPAWLPAFTSKLYLRFHRSRFYWPNFPYFLLQFLFGSMLSALFILYFKSASHWLAWLMTILLGALLVANEYLENQYRQFTISWTLFGFCAMLLFNFALPFLLGSIHAAWFYISTLLGAGFAYWLYKKTPYHSGSIKPVGLVAIVLMLAYRFDMVPPVPLVKRDMAVGYTLTKVAGDYQLSQQPSAWWIFWRKTSNHLQTSPGQRIYCFSSVFAPSGLNTKLYHLWQLYDEKQGWQTKSRIGYTLSGGRHNGFRGYTYKQGLQAGDWRVAVETGNNKTVAIQEFSVEWVQTNATPVIILY